MRVSKKKLTAFFIATAIVFCIHLPFTAAAQNPGQGQTAVTVEKGKPAVPSLDEVISGQRKQLDKAGETIGRGIEQIGSKASSRFGKWINAELIYGITGLNLIVCFILLFIVILIDRIFRFMIRRILKAIVEEEDQVSWKKLILDAMAGPLSLFIWVYGIYGAISPLIVHFKTGQGANILLTVVQKAADIGGIIAIFWFILRLVNIIDVQLKKWSFRTGSNVDEMLIPIVGKTLRVFIIVIGAILIAQNLTGVQIGPLLASLGIGGLAVALAAKDSIANFFGTLTILFDKPFQVGERVVIDSFDGTVEYVGFRSTKIRNMTGSLVTIPNEKIVNSALENIGRRPNLRWMTNITITYDTPPEKVERAVEIIRNLLDHHEGMNEALPPKVYFNGFNDWSLNIFVIAWYHPPNWWDYQEWLQRTCLEILKQFNAEGIEFAFPSSTVYAANDDKRQLKLKLIKGEGSEVRSQKSED
ncbi:MAG: mechanosensitive ion channel family protein [Desulfobacterales bacterium]|nr:mechanosensitive ion channel family protein [Desulfobacterales bacterium]